MNRSEPRSDGDDSGRSPEAELRRLAAGTVLAAWSGPAVPAWVESLVDEGLGGVVLFGSNIPHAGHVAVLADRLRSIRADLVIALDEEGGDVTRLDRAARSPHPGSAALGRVDDPQVTEETFRVLGERLAALGVDLTFAPVADVNTDDMNPVIGVRSFGADPELVARHVMAALRGLDAAEVAGCVKHFPGHGSVRVDSHVGLPVVPDALEVIEERDLPPFLAAVAANAPSVMVAHLLVPALDADRPTSVSGPVITGILRGRLCFNGAIVTDALDMAGVADRFAGTPHAAVAALAAGADALCLGSELDEATVVDTIEEIVRAVGDGRLSRSRVADAAARTRGLLRRHRGTDPSAAEEHARRLGGFGRMVARRAIRVDGSVSRRGSGLVLRIETAPSIAAGRMPWGIESEDLPAGWNLVSLDGTDSEGIGAALTAAAGKRPPAGGLVVVVREAHRNHAVEFGVQRLAETHPDLVLVEMGVPGRPVAGASRVCTFGAAAAQAAAAVEWLVDVDVDVDVDVNGTEVP